MQHSLATRHLNVWYGQQHALKDITIDLPARQITAIIGPSGCGKSTLLKSLNRLLELNDSVRISGEVLLDGANIYDPAADPTEVRTRIGLLAQKPFPLPLSIYDNVAYGMRIHGLDGHGLGDPANGGARFARRNGELEGGVTAALQAVGLWDEVRDRLKSPATGLSGGQQQRLCLARALAIRPEVLLCDESTAALDPISAQGIEELLLTLRGQYSLVIVTHNIAQARRLADYVLFMWLGELVEHGPAAEMWNNPQTPLAQAYISRKIG
jgi:phosphate transport system ATP-binding protein